MSEGLTPKQLVNEMGKNIYIVTKDDEPSCVTFSEHKALAMFDSYVRSGDYQQAAVHVTAATQNNPRLLLEKHRENRI